MLLTLAKRLAVISGGMAVAAFGFNAHPVIRAMGDTSWLKLQDSYYCGRSSCKQTLDYGGMTYDFHRHKILMFGGGHATALWNQVEEFDFDSLTWRQLYAPSPAGYHCNPAVAYKGDTVMTDTGLAVWPDGGTIHPGSSVNVRPISRHTYDALDMLHDTCLMIMSSTQEGKGGCTDSFWNASEFLHDRYVWIFDPIAVQWKRLSPHAFAYGTGDAVDPLTDGLYGKSATGKTLYKYDWKTMTRTVVNSSCPVGWELERSMVYYPPNHSLVLFAGTNIHEYRIHDNSWVTLNPSGEHQDTKNHQICYDPVNDVFGMIHDGAFHYYSPSANTWYKQPYDTLRYPKNVNFKHTIYDPVDNVYVLLIGSTLTTWQTWAYKFSDTAGIFPGTRTVSGVAQPGRSKEGPVFSVSPNPFNPTTQIKYRVEVHGKIALRVFDMQGRLIQTLVSGETTAGVHKQTFEGRDPQGRPLPAGIYMLSLETSGQRMVKRLFLVK